MTHANAELQSWHAERLPEIQRDEARQIAVDHINGIRLRADHLDEPLRTELISIHVAMMNLLSYVDKSINFRKTDTN